MTRWWRTARAAAQTVANVEVDGHIIQVAAEGDVSIVTGQNDPGSDESPGSTSIAPPADFVGKPIRGRDALLQKLWRNGRKQEPGRSVQVIHGIGGCGKTTVAMLLARAAASEGADVWWIAAANFDSLSGGMRQLCVALGAQPHRIDRAWRGTESAIDLVWELLSHRKSKWLLVVDGADEPTNLAAKGSLLRDGNGWIRPIHAGLGSVVVTSRDGNSDHWGTWCELTQVTMLSPAEGAAVLADYAGHHPGSGLDAERLAGRLGGLPLALRLAGSYLRRAGELRWPGTIQTYKEYGAALESIRIRELFPELEDQNEIGDRGARELIGQTWELSLQSLEARGFPEARPLLELFAHFSETPIPLWIVRPDPVTRFSVIQELTPLRLRVVAAALADLALVEFRNSPSESADNMYSGSSLSLHPLVRDVSRYPGRLVNSTVDYLSVGTIMLADAVHSLPRPDWEHWPTWQLIAPHAFHLYDEILKSQHVSIEVMEEITYCVFRTAQYLMRNGDYEYAAERQRSAYDVVSSVAGNNHPNALMLRHDLAYNLGERGQLAEAEAELREVIRLKSEVFGPTADETLASNHAHADVLWHQGRLGEAEQEFRQVIAEFDRRGIFERNAAGTRQNLAQVLLEQGKYAEAEVEIGTVLAKYRKDGHAGTDLLQSRFTLARIFLVQARYAEAINEMRRLAEELTSALGESHRTTLNVRHELGVAIQESGSPSDAVPVLRAVLVDRNKKLGHSHHETLSTRHQLALALHESGELDEARRHYKAALKRRVEVLGEQNMQTLATRFQLAVLLEQSGQSSAAEAEYLRVLEGERATQGMEHPNTLITRMTLVRLRLARGEAAAVLGELEEILAARRRIFGSAHPATQRTAELLEGVRRLGDSGLR